MSFIVRDNNRAGMWMYASNHDDFLALQNPQHHGGNIESVLDQGYIGEPTPTQFQEAHKKWRRILDEKNKEINTLQKQIMDLNCSYDVVEARLLKYKLDELQLANQEKDIEIRELRDQVTQQAQKWLVPNF